MRKRIAYFLARISVGLVFLLFGMGKFQNDIWAQTIKNMAFFKAFPWDPNLSVFLIGVVEIVTATALIFGLFTRFFAGLAALQLAAILILLQFQQIRDIGLLGICLFLMLTKDKSFSLGNFLWTSGEYKYGPLLLLAKIKSRHFFSSFFLCKFLIFNKRPVASKKFYRTIERIITAFNARNSANFRIFGFPYLRINRFLISLIKKRQEPEKIKQICVKMLSLEQKERAKEIQNLPDQAIKKISKKLDIEPERKKIIDKMRNHCQQLFASDQKRRWFHAAIKVSSQGPSEYSRPLRIFGFYAGAYFIVKKATQKAYQEHRQWHKKKISELDVLGKLINYSPREINQNYFQIKDLFIPGEKKDLGVRELNSDQQHKLAQAFAPSLTIDTVSGYDRIGKLQWKDDKVSVNEREPAVYYYLSNSFIKDSPVLQINYAFWYPGRLGPNAPWMERGKLDGMTIRVTLDQQGEPIIVDVTNNCGCYFFYLPKKEKVEKVINKKFELNPFISSWLPDSFPAKKLNFRINSGWHQAQHIDVNQIPKNRLNYDLVNYDFLEELPHPLGNTESVFNPHGLMKDCSRIEPYLFFPMGIPKVGYMRQRGNHAIKMVGRAHFTDPNLYNRDFRFK